MEITEIKVFPVQEERLRAYITIVLDGCFVIRDLKIINGSNGLFVAMPSKKRKDGSYRDIAHPLNKDTRTEMEEQILNSYLDTINQKKEKSSSKSGSEENLLDAQSQTESESEPEGVS